MRAVVVAHGDVLPSDRAVIGPSDYVVAADGGAFAIERWKLLPHLVVGDMDSLGDAGVERMARQGIPVAKFSAAKDESDLELAVAQAIEAGATEVVLLGALCGEPPRPQDAEPLPLPPALCHRGPPLERARAPA